MKCELCQKADAACAITRMKNGVEEELYVCKACAKADEKRRQAKSQRTRRIAGLPPGMSMTVTEFSAMPDVEADDPPHLFSALASAFHDLVSDIEREMPKKKKEKPTLAEFSLQGVESAYLFASSLHLEGLHLIGELEATKRAVRALGMDLRGVYLDGVSDAAHVYRLYHAGAPGRAGRVLKNILDEESNARLRLEDEMPRVFSDSLCRALAILKNCRLLSPGELFDLLSPLRLATMAKRVDGLTSTQIENLVSRLDFAGREDDLPPEERDRLDAERADDINKLFEEVMLHDIL